MAGADPLKDQSYFLAAVGGAALARCRFPLGGSIKRQVRQEAEEGRLPTAAKRSSAGICFIGGSSPGGSFALRRWPLLPLIVQTISAVGISTRYRPGKAVSSQDQGNPQKSYRGMASLQNLVSIQVRAEPEDIKQGAVSEGCASAAAHGNTCGHLLTGGGCECRSPQLCGFHRAVRAAGTRPLREHRGGWQLCALQQCARSHPRAAGRLGRAAAQVHPLPPPPPFGA